MTSPAPAEQPVKKIVIASDHAGYRYKRRIIEHLTKEGYQVEDFGTDSTESVDYPDFIFPAAKAVAAGEFDRGIVLGGSGNGEAIAANRIKGVRCAVCWNEKSARLARMHNDANMISLGERMVSMHDVYEIIEIWLTTPFEGGRHIRRIEKLDQSAD
ncbi:MAG: ribose 5-phosphate isomerase B [Planctomycetaceae bacterium]|nr:ribose 5-phosphate isomerase B [Planctomycetaceae bacterium]